MKLIYSLLFTTITYLGFSQKPSEPVLNPFHPMDTLQTKILLSDAINTATCGLWQSGDYKVFIELAPIKQYLQELSTAYKNVMQNGSNMDSITRLRYTRYTERLQKAVQQLEVAESGFDLRQLVVYTGLDNEERNTGHSAEVEVFVRQSLEKGEAAVFYKGERIFTLNKRRLADYVMSNITLYYDEPSNWAFSYIGHIHW